MRMKSVEDARLQAEAEMGTMREAIKLRARQRASAVTGYVSDEVCVDRFSEAMKEKLRQKSREGRGGWDLKECSQEFLSQLLHEHVEKGDPVDVANFCMMLQQRGERIMSKRGNQMIDFEHPLVGTRVVYRAGHPGAEPEDGTVSSVNVEAGIVFVVYSGRRSAEATSPGDLTYRDGKAIEL